jgi:sugar/nucleoside kinase (ribokinase family)
MSETYQAVAAGHICLDVIPDLSHTAANQLGPLLAPGRLVDVGPATQATGGPVSNTGLTMNLLGIDTLLMGKVGDDLFGQAIIRLINSYRPGLADGMIIDPAVASSYSIIISPPGIDRTFLHCPGANDTFTADDVRYNLLETVRLFHFGYPPLMKLMYEGDGRPLAEIFRRAKATGVTTSLDTALPDPASPAGQANWPVIFAQTLPHVDIFLPSIEEILYMLRRETYHELYRAAGGPNFLPLITPALLSDLAGQLLATGIKIVLFKLGDRGVYLRTGAQAALESMGRACPTNPAAWANQELWAPCFQVDVVGTTGSGDAPIAGFLCALLRDMSPEEAVTAAVAVGACNVEAPDAVSGIRPWEETQRRIAAGWPRHPLTLEAPGWQFDPAHQLWAARRDA